MLDKEAIQELSKAEAIRAARESLRDDGLFLVPLTNDFTVHDIERFMPNRRRARGTMTTSVIADFAAYTKAHAEEGATVFVNPDDMTASAVLNLGTPLKPGHADNRAVLQVRRTAAFNALLAMSAGMPLSQVQVAELLEDWAPYIACFNGDNALGIKPAIAAIRSITIEGLKRVKTEEQQLSASKSAFESVEAKADELLPTTIKFITEPYHGIYARSYVLRLAVRTGDKPTLTLRIINAEQHAEECAAELADRVREAIGDTAPVALGSYRAS